MRDRRWSVPPAAALAVACAAVGGVPLAAWAQAAAEAPAAPASASASASAPAPAPAPAPEARPPAAAAAPQQIEITGNKAADGQDERRRSVASRITYGREELDRMGDSSLGEVLKRLPGITVTGKPGRGGEVRMRGMGGGYTQILIDGERMARGFSLDEIAPEQIERIEIMRGPVAEYGTRAIAGTINVVMRSDFRRSANELRVGAGTEGRRSQAQAAWLANGNSGDLGYNLTATLARGGQYDESDTTTQAWDAQGQPELLRQVHEQDSGQRRSLNTSARLQWRFGNGRSLELQPYFNMAEKTGEGQTTLVQALGNDVPYTNRHNLSWSRRQLARLSGTWNTVTDGGGRLQVRFDSRLASSRSWTERQDLGGSDQPAGHFRRDDREQRETVLESKGKYALLLNNQHSASLGWEFQNSERNDIRRTSVDGQPSLTEFGDNIGARVQRVALYAQDEWEWTKLFSVYLGARWESIQTRSDSAADRISSRSAVFTPLLHMAWKLPNAPRDQVRLSLTRSYRAPDTSQLISRPNISGHYPDLSLTNSATHTDRAGNPLLKPELAWGLELGIEHYLDAGGLLAANVHYRRIDQLIRTVHSLDTVTWAAAPRWVSRPQNIGSADVAGLELEAKGRVSTLWAQAPALLKDFTVRSNFSLMWSRVNQVPGPDNRIKGQAPWTLNVGADGPLTGWPLTVGASLNFTPAFQVRQIDQQLSRQGVKQALDLYALWRLGPAASLRFSVGNVGARPYEEGSTTWQADGSSERSDTSNRTDTSYTLRGEFRF